MDELNEKLSEYQKEEIRKEEESSTNGRENSETLKSIIKTIKLNGINLALKINNEIYEIACNV